VKLIVYSIDLINKPTKFISINRRCKDNQHGYAVIHRFQFTTLPTCTCLSIDRSLLKTKTVTQITSQAGLNLLSAKRLQFSASCRKTLEFHWKHVVSRSSPVCPTIKPLNSCSGRINRSQLGSTQA
jgi:hypothetical protein